MNNKPEVLEYPQKCPVCGSEEKLVALLATKEMDKGINPDAVPHYLYTWPFVMRTNRPIIIGSKSPAGNIFVDVCKGCGIIRAVRIEIGEAMALAGPPKGQ